MIFNPALSGGDKSGWELIGTYENSVTVTSSESETTSEKTLRVLLPDIPSQDFLKMVINVDYSWEKKSTFTGTPSVKVGLLSTSASTFFTATDRTNDRITGRAVYLFRLNRALATGNRTVQYIAPYSNTSGDMEAYSLTFDDGGNTGISIFATFTKNAYALMTMKATVELYGSDL